MSNLKISPREIVGKKVKTVRAENKTPAVLFGPSFESRNINLDTAEFKKTFAEAGYSNLINVEIDGKKEKVIVKEVQIHPIKDYFIHVSLYVIDSKKKITADIPLQFEGMSQAEDLGKGFAIYPLDTITINCLPDNLPSEFVIDISKLAEVGDSITVSDIDLPEGVELDSKMDPTTAVAYITQAQKIEDLTDENAEGGEGEEGAEGEEGGDDAGSEEGEE